MTNVLAQAVSAGPPAAGNWGPKIRAWPDGCAKSCLARNWLELSAHSVNTLLYRVLLPPDNRRQRLRQNRDGEGGLGSLS